MSDDLKLELERAHELGGLFRHAGTKGRRDHAYASCACGVTFVGRDAVAVAAQHASHLERVRELAELKPHRNDPRWRRLRAACCDIVGSGVTDATLDDYVDVIYSRLIPDNNKRPPAAPIRGGGWRSPAAGR